MLNVHIKESKLFDIWINDIGLGFGCAAQASGMSLAWEINNCLRGVSVDSLSEQTLRSIAALNGIRGIKQEEVSSAIEILSALEKEGGVNHAVLEARAVSLLAQGNVKTIRDFCKWARRVSIKTGEEPYLWVTKTWSDLSNKIEQEINQNTETEINRRLAIFASDDSSGLTRIWALCELYDELASPSVYDECIPPV